MLTILFFFGNYCPSCKAMYPIMDILEKEFYNKLTVIKLNAETDPEEFSKYGVISIPTFIILKDNKQLEIMTGPQIKSKLEKKINSYLLS